MAGQRPYLARSKRVVLREPSWRDWGECRELARVSHKLHRPWVAPPATADDYRAYLKQIRSERRQGLLVCRRDDARIAGVINMNEIVRGVFCSTYLGYYAHADHAGQGYMTEGLGLALRYGFQRLKLHRMEANIIPENEPSSRLVQRLGFRLEGRSPRYLKIGGRWRDHDRWALTIEDWRAQRSNRPR